MSEALERKIASRKFIVIALTVIVSAGLAAFDKMLPWHVYAVVGTYLTGQSILDWKVGGSP